ncbi:MAG: hypothetical protein EBR01_00360 [Proteobacteria bacterium]|jgi:cytochrome c oxidase subunit IV|nr:hypothetical protein [Pseudomonadota bacterium]
MGHGEMTVEEVKKHVRKYYVVFGALLGLTIVTVAISYLHLPIFQAVLLAMAVASMKGGLVAAYFMHLMDEKKIIYSLLWLTVILFGFCMLIPLFTLHGPQTTY